MQNSLSKMGRVNGNNDNKKVDWQPSAWERWSGETASANEPPAARTCGLPPRRGLGEQPLDAASARVVVLQEQGGHSSILAMGSRAPSEEIDDQRVNRTKCNVPEALPCQ